MPTLKYVCAFVDFTYPDPLDQLAVVLSQKIFAGVEFVGPGEGIWDEVPALRLCGDFLGLRVELGGRPGEDEGFTLQLEPFDFPWENIPEPTASEANVDLAPYVRHLLGHVDGITLR